MLLHWDVDNKLIDLTGQTFGIWKVIEQAPRQDNKTRWICECTVCGARRSKVSVRLRNQAYAECDGKHTERLDRYIQRPGKPEGWAAATETYGHYRLEAKRRGLSFNIPRDLFQELTSQNCHYCGVEPSQKHWRRHFNGPFIYNGLDRKDSARGYEPDNVLACCGTCNVMKQDLPYQVFLDHISKICARHGDHSRIRETPKLTICTMGNTRLANIADRRLEKIDDRYTAASELRDRGLTVTEIAQELNISRMSVYRALSRYTKYCA